MTAAEPSASRALRTGMVHEVGALAAIAQRGT